MYDNDNVDDDEDCHPDGTVPSLRGTSAAELCIDNYHYANTEITII